MKYLGEKVINYPKNLKKTNRSILGYGQYKLITREMRLGQKIDIINNVLKVTRTWSKV